MIISHISNLDGKKIENKEVKDVMMKVLVSPKEGWNGYVMRVFEISEGGHTPRHTHPWEHINYIISGEGILHYEGKDNKIFAGSYACVPENTLHQFINTGKENLVFICIVPEKGHK